MRVLSFVAGLFCGAAAIGGCGERATPALRSTPSSYAYVLQAEELGETREDAVTALATSSRDWIIVDPSYTPGPEGRWKADELTRIRTARPGRKVLAYLSIGEAEDYRPYWQSTWDEQKDGTPDAGAPVWLLTENPNWKGNYRVRFWAPEWQALILAEVDRIAGQGFDGIFLDIVDAFERFEHDEDGEIEDHRVNPETQQSYRKDMVQWVGQVARRFRQKRPGGTVLPQNGAQLLAEPGYASLVSGLALENLFTNDDEAQPPAHARYITSYLPPLTRAGKPVLLTEYPTTKKLKKNATTGARQRGMVLLLTARDLAGLGNCPLAEDAAGTR